MKSLANEPMQVFSIWRRQHEAQSVWYRTSHTVKARTQIEAEAKLRRKFRGCGFHTMSLCAVIEGSNPNVGA